MGDDVRFVSHPGVTYNITKKFIATQNNSTKSPELITPEEADILLTASLVHDWGELKIAGSGHGDITFDQHTTEHEKKEGTIFEKALGWVDDKSDKIFIRDSYTEVVGNKTSKLGRMFNAVERIGYLNTALRTYSGWHGERISNWSGLSGNVLSNQIEPLLYFSQEYVYVHQILTKDEDLISRAFLDISRGKNMIARDGNLSFNNEKFNQAKGVWESRRI